MPAPRSSPPRSKLVFVSGSDLDSVKLDKDEQVDGAETLMELLQPALGDPCLNALRRILSLTYATADQRSSEVCVLDIRRLAIKPLGALGKELGLLRLPRVDADKSFERDHSAQVFLYMIVSAKELRRHVSVEGNRRRESLAELFDHLPADPVVTALRQVLSMTFQEATTPNQHDRIIEDIRYVAATALVPCNVFVERMEIEPAAMPTWRRFINGVDSLDGSDGDEDSTEGSTE